MRRIPGYWTIMALWLLAGQVLAADQERIERTITALATHGPRMAGYPGDGFAADLIERELVKAGVTGVVRESFVVAVPMERGAALEILGQEQEIPLASLWPNLVRTSTTGPEGIEGVLVYGGESEYASFDGMEVAGCVVLMEFNTWNNWQNAAALGARAIVFIAPEETTVFEARQKWHWAPLDVPRFWLERPLGLELRARLQQEALQVRVRARMDWEEHTSWNIWGVVPGVDPQLGKELWAVQAYYDGLSVVPGLNPAAESAAGIAALLELAHDLKEHPPGRSVALIATGGHFLGQAGIKAFLNRHARQKKPFRERMPKKFVADSLDTQRLVEELGERGLTPDSLGIHLKKDRASGLLELDSVELDTLVARLKLKRLEADSLAIPLQPDELEIEFFIALDLSSQSDQLGVWHNTRNAAYRRFFVPVGRSFTQHAEKAAQALGRASSRALANGISPIKGLSWDSYVSQDVVIPDGALAQSAGLMAVSLMTVNDARLSLDTPLDRPERVAFDHIHQQSELLNRLLHGVLSDADFFGPDGEALRQAHDKNITDILVDIRGGLRLLPRKSTTPDQGVAHGVVALEPPFNNKPWRPWIFVADEEGNYRARGLVPGSHRVQGFVLDERSGAVVYATDRGERAQAFGLVEQSLSKAETEWTTVVFPAAATEIYDRIHPRFLFAMGRNSSKLKILDRRGAPPQQYGYVLGDWMSTVMVLFSARGDSLRVVDQSVMLLNNAGATDEKSAQGLGYDLSGQKMIRGATLQFARDMWQLDEVRTQRMRRFAIENPRLQALHEQAKVLIDQASRAREALQWGAYIKYARAALGLESMAYQDVRSTQNDVVGGVVFFVALLVPAAFFGERLLFACTDIRRQLALFGLILLVIWILLSQVHPAFQLAHPAVILLALMIMVMALFVISLVMGRFNGFMSDLRQRQAGTSHADISRSGTSYVAFMLGISNMRRRVMRTGLTLATITILTFTVLSFTSFKPSIRFIGFEKDWTPAYAGALLHDVRWWNWEQPVFDYMQSHFAPYGTVVPRTWLSMGQDEQGYISVQNGERQADALALLGLSRNEPEVTGIDRALVAGTFFAQEREESIILPLEMAAQLGIEAADVGRVEVDILGKRWRVRGLFDSAKFERIRDLNNESLTPVKQKVGKAAMPGMEQLVRSSEAFTDLDIELGFEHLPASRVAILPYHWLASMDAPLYSVAVRFDEGVNGEELVQRFLSRTGFRFFVGLPGADGHMQALSYTSLGVTSMEGLGALFIPMLIAALIVLNTMMGAVYERFREIGVYSSVGLAPLHIAFLFIAEACVYGVLGVTLGYLLGQVVAKLLLTFDLLSGVSLNYSSSAAIGSAVLVFLVVLASTLYPARVASRLAVPDVVRRWQLPPPEGDTWQFTFPFTVNRRAVESLCGYLYTYFTSYGHESVGKLYTEKTRIVVEAQDAEKVYSVQLLVWLAPFDMGVSQYLQFVVQPTEIENIYSIELYLERISGPLAFWKHLNLGFMLGLRQQFLVWQTLRQELQEEHVRTARQVAVDAAQVVETSETG